VSRAGALDHERPLSFVSELDVDAVVNETCGLMCASNTSLPMNNIVLVSNVNYRQSSSDIDFGRTSGDATDVAASRLISSPSVINASVDK
jgi:hypothetical protein